MENEMIGIVDVSVQAHNVSMPLYPMRAFEGSPSSIRVRSVPKKIGNWQINKVYFAVAYPDNTTQTVECKLIGGVYVGTITGCNTVGNVQNGYSIYADGVDENGNAVTNYCLGKGDIQILDARGITQPLQNTTFVQILSAYPTTPSDGDMWYENEAWFVWQNGQALPLGDDSGLISQVSAELSTKQDKLTDPQISAIDSVVDARTTKVKYQDNTTSSFNIVGELTYTSIPNISAVSEVDIGDGITRIGNSTFNGCYNLVRVSIPDSVTHIGNFAFWTCKSLASVDIPDSVTSVGSAVFQRCFSLSSIHIGTGLTCIDDTMFSGCSSLVDVDIPYNITAIKYSAFQACYSLANVTIPYSVKSIDDTAFANCHGLTNVTIPNSVTSIGYGAFEDCTSLSSVTIPESVTSVGCIAFSECSSLTSIVVKGKTQAEAEAMLSTASVPAGCTITAQSVASQEWVNEQLTAKADVASLNNYQPKLSANQVSAINQVLDERQTVIDFGAYGIGRYDWVGELNKDVLTAAGLYNTSQASWTKQPIDVKLGTTISSIGYGVFQSCQQLTSVTMPNSIKSIGGYAFSGCMSLAKADLPSELSSIGDGAFIQNFALSSIHLPSTLKSMGSGAFQYCAMTDLQIAEGVTDIGSGAFTQSDSLKHVEFPSSISAIGRNAFQGSNSLTSVVFKDKTFGQVSAMANYPWYISDPGSIITTYTPASQEWVKEYIAQYLQEHNT